MKNSDDIKTLATAVLVLVRDRVQRWETFDPGPAIEATTSKSMRIALRVIASIVAIAVIQTAVLVGQFALRGGLGPLVRSGALGLTTIAGWLIVLMAGPVAAIQLWRLRRSGLFVTVTLCGIAFAYYVIGLFFLRVSEAPVIPIIAAIVEFPGFSGHR